MSTNAVLGAVGLVVLGYLFGSLSPSVYLGKAIKGVDLRVRPINHRLEDRVRAHILLCTLAYYVEWHMRQALAPLLYADEDLEGLRGARDPRGQGPARARCPAQTRRPQVRGQSVAAAPGRADQRAVNPRAQHLPRGRRQDRRALHPQHRTRRLSIAGLRASQV